MATYYRWNRYTIDVEENNSQVFYMGQTIFSFSGDFYSTRNRLYIYIGGTFNSKTGNVEFSSNERSDYYYYGNDDRWYDGLVRYTDGYFTIVKNDDPGITSDGGLVTNVVYRSSSITELDNTLSTVGITVAVSRYSNNNSPVNKITFSVGPGTSQGYVYDVNSSAYPNGGVSGDYYYDQRTTVISPTEPSNLSYPATITSRYVNLSWTAATSNVPNAPVQSYQVGVKINDGYWMPIYDITNTTYTYEIDTAMNATSIQFQVRAKDSNGESSDFITGPVSQVIRAPGAPTVSAPSTAISGESITVTWGAVSGATSYTVQRNTGGSWTQVYSGNALTFSETVGVWDSLQYRVQAVNQAGGGSWGYSGAITVYTSPTLTTPEQAMQGQSVPVSWTAIEGADSYTLQRKSSADSDWVQVYSGANLSYSEVAGTWTTVQYRVQAVFDGTPGGWATSAEIPVVSASALVISGQDGDLGVVVNDIPYSISTDTGNQITATISVNSAPIFSGNVTSGAASVIPVLDLISGEGTITIEASVQANSGTVTAVRTWTYTKTIMTFPNAGSIAELTKDGKVMWPETLANAVRLPGGKTLDQVMGFPCQIFTGSYVGTGTFGEENPTEITAPFEPKFAIISNNGAINAGNSTTVLYCGQTNDGGIAAIWRDGNSIKYYANNVNSQCNSQGITYRYVILG